MIMRSLAVYPVWMNIMFGGLIAEQGDVIAYYEGVHPEALAEAVSPSTDGFVIDAYRGSTFYFVSKSTDENHNRNIIIWRRIKGYSSGPRRLPLNKFHSKPLPLP